MAMQKSDCKRYNQLPPSRGLWAPTNWQFVWAGRGGAVGLHLAKSLQFAFVFIVITSCLSSFGGFCCFFFSLFFCLSLFLCIGGHCPPSYPFYPEGPAFSGLFHMQFVWVCEWMCFFYAFPFVFLHFSSFVVDVGFCHWQLQLSDAWFVERPFVFFFIFINSDTEWIWDIVGTRKKHGN